LYARVPFRVIAMQMIVCTLLAALTVAEAARQSGLGRI
jgi:hypothetical protein